MTIEIRAAGPGDVPAILALWVAAETHATATDDPESVGRLIAHDPGALLVAVVDATVVGSVIAGWDGWRGSIYRLAVSPAHRRLGIGRALVGAAERRLEGLGAQRLQAAVVSDNERAMAFWQASSWEEQRQRTRFVRTAVLPD
jgi:ribosomal protein S18 acetylase RimI-like enzyme